MDLPNILIITSHDTGDWLKCYGHESVNTPNLDALAAEGCRFANSYCASPICSPSRGAMMTGRYPQSNGLMGVIQEPYRWHFNAHEKHLSHLLKEQGYHTVLFNHQHEAPHDDHLGFCEHRISNCGSFELLTGEHVSTANATADEFSSFLKEREKAAAPFFAQVGFFETHTPFDWSGAEADESSGVEIPPYLEDNVDTRKKIALLQGAIRYLDQAVGKILNALSEYEIEKNTIVVFASDHGVELPHNKWELYEGGIRTSLIMRVPQAKIQGGSVCDWLVSNVDLVPTLLELVDLPLPQNLQGRSVARFFLDSKAKPHRNTIFSMMHSHGKWVESRCVRTQNYKLIMNFSPCRFSAKPIRIKQPIAHERPARELYDLTADPSELCDLSDDISKTEIKDELTGLLLGWLKEVNDPVLAGPVPTPYYRIAIEALMKGASLSI